MAHKKRDALTSVPFPVIRLGLEPKTYCLEGSCSIQLSYRTSLVVYDILLRKSAAKVDIFSETAKLFSEILQRNVSNYFFAGFQLP